MTGPLPVIPSYDGTRRRRRGPMLLVVLTLGCGAAGWYLLTRPGFQLGAGGRGVPLLSTTPLEDRAPAGVRIRVRVVNATNRRGLARRATLQLRDHGFDVVEYDTERGIALEQTEIVQHRGDADWSARLRRALGAGQRVSRPDSLVDVEMTVRLGRDWEPSAEPLRP